MYDTSLARRTGWGKLRDFEDRLFTPRKLRRFGLALLAAHVIALAVISLNGHWLFRPDGRLNCVDFGFLWLSGIFAASADPGRVYDLAAFGAAQANFFGAGNCILIHHFEYPPVLLFFTAAIGWLPYFAAFAVWNIVLLLLYLGVVYAILPRANAIIGALTPMAAARDLQLGHNGLLTAGLVGLPLVLLERSPFFAGSILGLLTYKPQFGLLFPVALLASRNWRALSGAILSTLALALTAAFAFGADTWPSFFLALGRSSPSLSPETSVGLQLQSIYGLLQWAGLSVQSAWAIHSAAALMIAMAVWRVWSKPVPHALRACMLCIGCLLVNPYLLQYDFCVLTVAVAFLISDGLSRGFLPGERSIVALGWLALIWLDAVRPGPVIFCAILLWIVYRRIIALRDANVDTSGPRLESEPVNAFAHSSTAEAGIVL